MSRCFPFLPPGYEQASRIEVADLVVKEKNKEKKHKEDKEEREGKEKKDKEKRRDKYKEKKDRKEKHKEKKKDRENRQTPDEKTDNGKHDGCNGQLGESCRKFEKLRDSSLVEELGKRNRDDATRSGTGSQMVQSHATTAGTGSQMVQNLAGAVRRNEVVGRIVGTQKRTEWKDHANRIGTGSQIVQSVAHAVRRNEGVGRIVETEKKPEGKIKNNDDRKPGDRRKAEKQKVDEHRGMEIARNTNGADQRNIFGIRLKENEADNMVEGNEKVNRMKAFDDGRGEKVGDKHSEDNRSDGKAKGLSNETKKEKAMTHENHKHSKDQAKLKGSSAMEHIGKTLNIKSPYPPTDNNKSAYSEENLKKRKELNGFIHENDMRPNKLSRPASTLLPCENGKQLETSGIALSCDPTRQGSNDGKADASKEHKIDRNVKAVPSSVLPRPSFSIKASENGEVSTRPPHPDSKYLSQILSIPKVEWSDYGDDQEWLFGSDSLSSKHKVVSCNVSEMPKVWAEAMHIESADVHALPYVIPY